MTLWQHCKCQSVGKKASLQYWDWSGGTTRMQPHKWKQTRYWTSDVNKWFLLKPHMLCLQQQRWPLAFLVLKFDCVSSFLALHSLYKQSHFKVVLFSLNTNNDFCFIRMECGHSCLLSNDFFIEVPFTATLPFN